MSQISNNNVSRSLFFYTGTNDQPDTASVFFKNDQNQISFIDENSQDAVNYNPLNFVAAVLRIKEATRMIFLSLKGREHDLGNATKNLSRGMIALLPIGGNATLYLYDRIKTRFYTHPRIKRALSDHKGPMLGIAFDGKVIKTLSLNEFSTALNGQPQDPLMALAYLWYSGLERKLKNSSKSTRLEWANQLSSRLVSS